MDGKFLCQPDIKRWSLSYHRTIWKCQAYQHPCHSTEIRSRFKTFIWLLIQLHSLLVCMWKMAATLESLFLQFWWYLNPCRAHPSPMTACEQGMSLQGWEHRTVSASTRTAVFTNKKQPGKWWLTLLINLFLLSNPPLVSWSHQNPESTQPSEVCCFHSRVFTSIFFFNQMRPTFEKTHSQQTEMPFTKLSKMRLTMGNKERKHALLCLPWTSVVWNLSKHSTAYWGIKRQSQKLAGLEMEEKEATWEGKLPLEACDGKGGWADGGS